MLCIYNNQIEKGILKVRDDYKSIPKYPNIIL